MVSQSKVGQIGKIFRTGLTECRMPADLKVVPGGWSKADPSAAKQKAYYNRYRSLYVIITEEKYGDDWWRHVSVSHAGYVPNWKEMCIVKDLFIGKDKKAIQVHPPKKEHYNFCSTVLHLWCNLDRDVLPNFLGPEGAI